MILSNFVIDVTVVHILKYNIIIYKSYIIILYYSVEMYKNNEIRAVPKILFKFHKNVCIHSLHVSMF